MTQEINNEKNQLFQNINFQNEQIQNENIKETKIKRHRRSKNEIEGRNFKCECGKSYLSQPALNNHIKNKHPEKNKNGEQRGRGRPKKKTPNIDFETEKYDIFFLNNYRKKKEKIKINILNIVNNVFDSIFVSYGDKCFSHPKSFNDNFILNSLINNLDISNKDKKNADDEFYEYLIFVKDNCNSYYFSLILKFVLLFRECLNLKYSKIGNNNNDKLLVNNQNGENDNKNNDNNENNNINHNIYMSNNIYESGENSINDKIEYSSINNGEKIPQLCNEFYSDFLEENNFFGIIDEKDRLEIIEIIQHFCTWLYKQKYTKSKLSLTSS